jgi:capsular exopolysaccharide synthesis family protein
LEKFVAVHTNSPEGIDTDKLLSVLRKNKWPILLIFLVCNLFAYLTIRWTKDLFESESEMKLDIKQDATELGIKAITEDPSINIIAGEIEQMKSKVFLNRLIDSLNIGTSYYSIGNVLKEEMYKTSPIKVTVLENESVIADQSIYFNFIDNTNYKIKLNDNDIWVKGVFTLPLDFYGTKLLVSRTTRNEPDDNNYYFVLHSRNMLINYLAQNISISPLNFNANTIRVSFKDYNARKASDIVNKIDSLYITYSTRQKNLTNTQKINWLNKELEQVEKRMQNFENYFENFILENKSSDLQQDLKKTIISINVIDSQRFVLAKKITLLNETIEGINTGQVAFRYQHQYYLPEYLNAKLEELYRLQKESDRLALAYNENTFAFRQKEKELNTIKGLVYDQVTELKKEWLKTVAELKQRRDALEKEFASMPTKNTEYSKNQRFYKLYEEFYLSMMQSKAQFEIAQAGNTPDFKILSPATLPTIPISPKRLLIIGIGLVASIAINFFFIGISYLLNNKLTSVHEVERTIQVPLIGVIPISDNKSISKFHVIEKPKSMVSESIRSLRTNLDFFNVGENKKIITITSSISGEGKSFLATNLSSVLSMSMKKVVLLDLDMRKHKNESSFLGIDQSKGISTILIRKNTWQECIQKTEQENLFFIPAGPHPPNPSELLLSEDFPKLLEDLKKDFDCIVIDTPPVGLVTDGIMAMKISDISIYVVRANYSKREFLNTLNRIVNIHKLSRLAVVLNALPNSGQAYGYGYYGGDAPKKKNWKKLFKV